MSAAAADDCVDVLVVGAGPTGLACAIEARRGGLSARVIEKGCLVDAIHRFPTEMTFFTTKERLTIGDLPMSIPAAKPTRAEALAYYRAVATHHRLDVRTRERAVSLAGEEGAFELATRDRFERPALHRARTVVVSTGYFDHANRLGVDGEDLPHVAHWYRDAHEATGDDVVVIGGGNSASEAALELFRVAARVTVVVKKPELDDSVKYWVKPDLENRIAAGEVAARFESHVTSITADAVQIEGPGGPEALAARHVFALTGYRPDAERLAAFGIDVDAESLIPSHDRETFETNVPGVFLAGSVVAGRRTGRIFIENGRLHAATLGRALAARLGSA